MSLFTPFQPPGNEMNLQPRKKHVDHPSRLVMAGLDPAIHALLAETWVIPKVTNTGRRQMISELECRLYMKTLPSVSTIWSTANS
jgi:hypothetical protein